jgi:hypothetical protein
MSYLVIAKRYSFSSKELCIGHLSITVTKTYKEKITVSTHSFRGCNPSLLWAWGKAEHHGREMLWSKAAHLIAAGKQKEGARVAISPSKANPQWPYFLPLGVTS